MSMIRLKVLNTLKEYWVNTDNICYIRQNYAAPNKSVVISFSETRRPNDIQEVHVEESIDEVMSMVDKPALLAEKIRRSVTHE